MEYVQIPSPEFGFDDIAREKARLVIKDILHQNSLLQYFLGGNSGLEQRLQNKVLTLSGNYERIICVVELLNFLLTEEEHLKNNLTFSTREPAQIATGFNKIRYVLYSLARAETGYTFDKNAFSIAKVMSINTKIEDILFALQKLEVGQEVIFNEFDAVKGHITEEFQQLKSLPALGKKTFYQLMFGKVASFTGNKLADEIFKVLSPHIVAILAVHAPHLVEEFKKLFG